MCTAYLVAIAVLGGTVVQAIDVQLHASAGRTDVLHTEVRGGIDTPFHGRKMLVTAVAGTDDVEPICEDLLTGYDFVGENLGPATLTDTDQDCIDLCGATDGCNAMSRSQSGMRCFLKYIPDGFLATPKVNFNSYMICSSESTTEVPDTTSTAIQCAHLMIGEDFADENVAPSSIEESDQACIDSCTATTGCNSMSRIQGSGRCFRKYIGDDKTPTPVTGINSYLLCPDSPPAVQPSPAPFDAEATFVPDARSTAHPDSSAHEEEPHVPDGDVGAGDASDVHPLEQGSHAWFDYQPDSAYNPSLGTRVVVRDWFYGQVLFTEASYSICHINAFQTLLDCDDCHDRPDITQHWPADLVLADFEDPGSSGSHLIDISTPSKRTAAAAHVHEMVLVCKDKLFNAVEFDDLDSYKRFENLPFDMADTVEYAKLLVENTRAIGMGAGQHGAVEIIDSGDYSTIGFDFAVTENCGKDGTCMKFSDAYAGVMVGVEYTHEGFLSACESVADHAAIVQRDVAVGVPADDSYVMLQCGP